MTRFWVRAVAALVGGALLAASFPPYDLVWLAPAGLALLTLAWHGTRARTGLLLGLLGGLAFFVPLLDWMRVIGDDAWLALATYCALWWALLAAGVAVTSRLRWWPLAVPLLWVGQEFFRDRYPLGGFPWGRLAFGQTDTLLTPYAALGGAPAVTFAVALIGSLLAWLVLRARSAPPRRTVGAVVLLALVAVAGGLVPRPVQGQTTGGPASVVAAVVQGDVPQTGLDAFGQRRAVLDNHVRVTKELAARVAAGEVPAPEAVVWPENSTDIDPTTDAAAHDQIQSAVDAIGAPTLVGAVVTDPADPTRVRNVGIVWGPTGSADAGMGQYYVKEHPVPFGEWIPARALLTRFIARFELVPRDFVAGESTGVLALGPARIGDLICFEVAYDSLARDAVTGDGGSGELAGLGGRILVVQTNNATYGRTGQPEQQLAMSQLRAVEHGRAVLVAATSGISAVIAPDGHVVQRIDEFEPGTIVTSVPLRDSLTIADRVGAWPEVAAMLAGLLALVIALRTRPRRREDIPSSETTPMQETAL